MIIRGNFSGDAAACYAMGETAFKAAHRGKINCDINTLWDDIVKAAKPETKEKTEKKK
ncbi:MAG TPA: hypothetical protein VGF79_00840 [Bacteroidia bacterium]